MSQQLNDLHTQNANFSTKIPVEAYNLYVAPNQHKTALTISMANKGDFTRETEILSKGEESYKPPFTLNQNYSNTMIRQANINLEIQNIRYGQNRSILKSSFILAADENLGSFNGLPHPYLPGISGFKTDVMNSMVENYNVKMGSTYEGTSDTLTPELVNIMRSSVDKSVLHNDDYLGQLYPETMNLDILREDVNRCHILPWDVNVSKWNRPKIPDNSNVGTRANCVIEKSDARVNRMLNSSNTLSLDEINQDPNNMLSFSKRGAIYKNATYTFSKRFGSQNFRMKFDYTDDPNIPYCICEPYGIDSTILWTAKYGIYQFPTNIENWQECLDNGLSPYDVAYYYDKCSFMIVKASAKGDDDTLKDEPFYEEPLNQSVHLTLTFANVRSPVLSSFCSDTHSKSFSRVSDFELSVKHHANLSDKLFRIVGKPGSGVKLKNQLPDDTVHKKFDLLPCTYEDGIISMDIDTTSYKAKLHYRLFRLIDAIEPYKNVKSTVNCTLSELNKVPFTITCSADPSNSKIRKFNNGEVFEVRSVVRNLTSGVPKYVLIYVDNINVPYKIVNLSVIYNNGEDKQRLSTSSLREATINNAMWAYSAKNEDGYLFTSNASVTKYSNTSSAYPRLFGGTGTVLYLQAGIDFMLPDSVIGGMLSANNSLEFVVSIKIDDQILGTSKAEAASNSNALAASDLFNRPNLPPANVCFTYLSEIDYYLENNMCSKNRTLIQASDYTQLMLQFRNDVTNNSLDVEKDDAYIGSGFNNKRRSNRHKAIKFIGMSDNVTDLPVDISSGGGNIGDYF